MGENFVIKNTRNSVVVSERASLASTSLKRLVGLIGRKNFQDGEALVLPSCRMVHMFFMRFTIDVVFCSEQWSVLAIEPELRPWRISRFVPKTAYVIELPRGTIKRAGIRPRDVLEVV